MSNWRGSLPFGSEEIHSSLGYIKRRQTIEECRKSYLRQLSKNRKGKPIQIFNHNEPFIESDERRKRSGHF